MINFQTNAINKIAMPVNFKANSEEKSSEEKNIAETNSLDNPSETAGRSQVNFKGVNALSAKELNSISRRVSELKLDSNEIKVAKQALVDTMNEYECKSLKQFTRRINNSLDNMIKNREFGIESQETEAQDMLSSFANNALKIDSNVNTNRITSVLDDFIAKP